VVENPKAMVDTSPATIDISPPIVETSLEIVETSPEIVETSQEIVDTSPAIVETSQEIVKTTPKIPETPQDQENKEKSPVTVTNATPIPKLSALLTKLTNPKNKVIPSSNKEVISSPATVNVTLPKTAIPYPPPKDIPPPLIKDICLSEQPKIGNLNTSNPMWNSFLDTDCSSATDFFSLPNLSKKENNRAPKPWVSNRGSTFRKVSFTVVERKKTPPPEKTPSPEKEVAFPFARDAYPFAGEELIERDLDKKIKENIKIWRESQPDLDEIKAFVGNLDPVENEEDVNSYNAIDSQDKVNAL